MIVDDDPDFAEMAQDLLGRIGWRCVIARSGDAALELLKTESPHVVLLDLHMPGCDGFEVLRYLKSAPATRVIPVIICSITQTAKDRERAISEGAQEFLPKTKYLTELIPRLQRYLNENRTLP